MVFGAIIILSFYPAFMQMEHRDLATICFVIGIILNFGRPVTAVRNWFGDLFNTFSLRKARTGYVNDIEQQKEQAEEDLYSQKRDVEAELKRQKYEAEQDIARQRREAEEEIKRQAEELHRKQRQYQNEQHQQSSQNDSGSSSSSNSSGGTAHLTPSIFADACEILGMGQGCGVKEYKAAYKKLINLYHPDRVSGLSGSRKTQAENEAKQINAAWNTIRKKLR